MLMTYLLRTDVDPLMFHQPNLIAYDGTHSLLGDLLDATFTKYNRIFNLPIQSPSEEELGVQFANRMAYNASGVTAQLVANNKLVLKAQHDATIPVTGAITSCGVCQALSYGKQNITTVKIKAGQTLTVTLQNVAPAPTPRLNLTKVTPNNGPIAGGGTVTITGKSFVAGATVAFGDTPATNVTIVNSTSITATVPAHAAGAVTVSVTSNGEQTTLANGYTYQAAVMSGSGGPPPDPAPAPAPAPAPIPTGRGGLGSTGAPATTSNSSAPNPAPLPPSR